RTFDPPRCWATSAMPDRFSPATSKFTSTAWRISGSSPGGNSMSTTGPATLTMRPLLRDSLPVVVSVISHLLLSRTCRLAQRLGPAHGLGDGGGDLRLAGPVGRHGEPTDEFVGVVGGGLHGPSAGGML